MTATMSDTVPAGEPAQPPGPPESPATGRPTDARPPRSAPTHGTSLHVRLAVVLFAPAALLVVDGNLAVDDALIRFALALLASGAALALLRAVTGGGAAGPQAEAGPPGPQQPVDGSGPARLEASPESPESPELSGPSGP